MLRVTLHVNSDRIADYEVRRVTSIDRRPEPDDINVYAVSEIPSMHQLGAIDHRYGDGAHQLAAAALDLAYRNPPSTEEPKTA